MNSWLVHHILILSFSVCKAALLLASIRKLVLTHLCCHRFLFVDLQCILFIYALAI